MQTPHHTNEYLEKNIYKILQGLESNDTIKISNFLERLQLNKIIEEKRYIKYSNISMIKALIFMKLKGMKFQTKLVKYLKGNENDALNLGFYRDIDNKILIPNQRTFSYFANHILDEETKSIIDFIVEKTESVAEKFGVVFDVEILEVKREEKGTEKTFYNRKMEKCNEFCRLVKKEIYPHIRLDLHHNAIYKKSNFLDALVYTSMRQDFTENGCNTLRMEAEYRTPLADTLLHHIKKYDSIESLEGDFIDSFKKEWKIAKTSNVFYKRKYDIAIDFTDWLYYGKDVKMVVRGEFKNGTTKRFRFATVNIVEAGNRFTLLALPVGIFDSKEKITTKLLKFAKERIRINRIYVDRGFFSGKMINVLKKYGTFLTIATENSRIKKIIENMPAPTVVKDYAFDAHQDVKFNLVVVQHGQNKRAYATNMNIPEKEVNLFNYLDKLYGKRWGIETSYRMKKGFRAKTTSKNYIVRLFYFLFSTLLYNLWMLIDALIALSLVGTIKEKYMITSKMFGTILYTVIDPGGT
jgi:putative transposase